MEGTSEPINIDAIWEIELGFWLNGPDHYRRHLAENAMMVFPHPAGLLVGQVIVLALEGAPRWKSVDFVWKEQVLQEGLFALAYQAVGRRDGAAHYLALCSPTTNDARAGRGHPVHARCPPCGTGSSRIRPNGAP